MHPIRASLCPRACHIYNTCGKCCCIPGQLTEMTQRSWEVDGNVKTHPLVLLGFCESAFRSSFKSSGSHNVVIKAECFQLLCDMDNCIWSTAFEVSRSLTWLWRRPGSGWESNFRGRPPHRVRAGSEQIWSTVVSVWELLDFGNLI